MFTGIVEAVGTVESLAVSGSNHSFWVRSPLSDSLRVDQSLSHDGVCLTVEELAAGAHRVTAIAETLAKTNLGRWSPGSRLNLETCLRMNGRLDGHIVQGHVDTTAVCDSRADAGGSWVYRFRTDPSFAPLMIEKGSIAVNGISLTIFDVARDAFSVAIIPYTFEHTNIASVDAGAVVNIEFDMIGKYVQRKMSFVA